MSNPSIVEQLDQAIEKMLAAPDAGLQSGAGLDELLEVAAELRDLPRDNFRTRLRLELEWEAAGRAVSANASHAPNAGLAQAGSTNNAGLLSLFGKVVSGYPVRRSNMALSFAVHMLMVLAMGAGLVMVKSMTPQIDTRPYVTVRLEPYAFPIGSAANHGGGSGGAAEKTPASIGVAPKAMREQLTPPVMLRNMQPKIVAETSVIAPELKLPNTRQIGDPLSLLALPSNGPGVGSGIGGNYGTGVGSRGNGPGRGNGSGGGCCDGVYVPGSGVSMPRAIYSPEPEFSEEARKLKFQGDVILLGIIGADGLPRNLTVVRTLGMGLDEKALEAVRNWRFDPARKDGHPVAVQMNIIVNFRLY